MFQRLLFKATLTSAAVLAILPWLSPFLGSHPLVQLFATDAIVRRTVLFSAVGLAVTAFVFFRSPPEAKVRKASNQYIAGA